MSAKMEDEVKRWATKRKSALVLDHSGVAAWAAMLLQSQTATALTSAHTARRLARRMNQQAGK